MRPVRHKHKSPVQCSSSTPPLWLLFHGCHGQASLLTTAPPRLSHSFGCELFRFFKSDSPVTLTFHSCFSRLGPWFAFTTTCKANQTADHIHLNLRWKPSLWGWGENVKTNANRNDGHSIPIHWYAMWIWKGLIKTSTVDTRDLLGL